MSFVNLKDNVVYEPYQIEKRMLRLERNGYPAKAERDLLLVGTAVALTKRPVHPHEDDAINDFNTFMGGMEVLKAESIADNDLLKRTISYEKSIIRLERYILLEGQVGQEYEEATYDDFGVELAPEILYIPTYEPLPEFVEIMNNDDPDNPYLEEVRNPLVVQDEDERLSAQTIINNANEEVLNLVALRG